MVTHAPAPRTDCRSCRFFSLGLTSINVTAAGAGECRKDPPRVETEHGDHGWRIWPAVWPRDWCGAHAPIEEGRGP